MTNTKETLPKFPELTTSNRGAPCQEYPGEWLVCIPESLGPYWNRWWFSKDRPSLGHSFPTFDEAFKAANSFMTCLEGHRVVVYKPSEISICWKCTDGDPRMGQCWFTGFYQAGRFNSFGDYQQT